MQACTIHVQTETKTVTEHVDYFRCANFYMSCCATIYSHRASGYFPSTQDSSDPAQSLRTSKNAVFILTLGTFVKEGHSHQYDLHLCSRTRVHWLFQKAARGYSRLVVEIISK